MRSLNYANYALDVAESLIGFEELKEGLIDIGQEKMSKSGKIEVKTIAEAYGIKDDNMIAILTILYQVDNSEELRKKMITLLNTTIGNMGEDKIRSKIDKAGDSAKVSYSIAIIDCYEEYLRTGECGDMPNREMSKLVESIGKAREIGNVSDLDFYGIGKSIKESAIDKYLGQLTKEQLIGEIKKTYRMLESRRTKE